MDDKQELWKHFNVTWSVWMEFSDASKEVLVYLNEEETNNFRELEQDESFEDFATDAKDQYENGDVLIWIPDESVQVVVDGVLCICE